MTKRRAQNLTTSSLKRMPLYGPLAWTTSTLEPGHTVECRKNDLSVAAQSALLQAGSMSRLPL